MPINYRLWTGKSIIPATIPMLSRHDQVGVHYAKKNHYQFLLGADIVPHNDLLACSWGNSLVDENDSSSIMAGSISTDGGYTWGPFERIAIGTASNDACSHGVLFHYRGELLALAPHADFQAQGNSYPELKVELLVRTKSGEWQSRGIVIDREQFWPMSRPEPLVNGNLIMPGIICRNHRAEPAVAICHQDNIRSWRIIAVPLSNHRDNWGEGGLLIAQNEIRFIFRNGWKHRECAQFSLSQDFGESWSAVTNTNLPMAPAKPCCGTLSDGRIYIVFNPAGNYRNTLAIAVSSAPRDKSFSKVWRIQHGESPLPRYNGCGKGPQWAYPMACEHDGKLYVTYTASKEDCILSIIPLSALS